MQQIHIIIFIKIWKANNCTRKAAQSATQVPAPLRAVSLQQTPSYFERYLRLIEHTLAFWAQLVLVIFNFWAQNCIRQLYEPEHLHWCWLITHQRILLIQLLRPETAHRESIRPGSQLIKVTLCQLS
ncbi:Hypothetical_protein [Hexamita inflata]|uniref:Hypothetical_protein n=1 Tax=Hexamita inflata TaxID=28002 RepID=A0AA86Q146_9EUKA|nr:Hypothetical protein HINF_LOCUS35258 [Hexamita inflata]